MYVWLVFLLCFYTMNQNKFSIYVGTVSDGAATNKHSVTTLNTAKLDQESEELKHDKVPLEIGKLIQKGRQDKGLTQKDLATVHSCLIIEIFFALEIEMLPLLLYFFNRYAENQWEATSYNWLWSWTRNS